MAKQFIFTLISRNPKNEIVTQNVPGASLQEAVAANKVDGVLFAVYQNRNSAKNWLAHESEK